MAMLACHKHGLKREKWVRGYYLPERRGDDAKQGEVYDVVKWMSAFSDNAEYVVCRSFVCLDRR